MNGKRVKGTKQQLMIMTLATRAASGDVQATKALIPLVLQVLGPEDRGVAKNLLSPQDQEIFDELLQPLSKDQPSANPKDPSSGAEDD